jgi:DNA-directed RNA polymerase subunit M/transcription elongation factor TFIIS
MAPATRRGWHLSGKGGEARKAFDPASLWKMIRMRFPWQPRVYARACAECGYTWRVPRWAAQRRVRSISMISVASRTTIDRGELTREIESASAANQSADTFRHCPECGADHFTQRALRSESPD